MCAQPLISVIVPTYNRADLLPRAIESVLSQSYENFEVIIIDDNSSDNTQEVVENIEDDRLHYIRKNSNEGGSKARNTGIRESKGEYVAFLDSDDEWKPTKLEKQINIVKENSELGVVYTGTKIVKNGERKIGNIPSKKGDIFKDQLISDQISPTSAVIVKKDCFTRIGLFDPALPARQDYDLWLRLSREFEFGYVKEPLTIIYRGHEDRISTNIDNRIEGQLKLLEKLQKEIMIMDPILERKVYSGHYHSLGRHLWIQNNPKLARKFLIKAITYNPLKIKLWIIFIFSILSINSDNKILQYGNNLLKRGL